MGLASSHLTRAASLLLGIAIFEYFLLCNGNNRLGLPVSFSAAYSCLLKSNRPACCLDQDASVFLEFVSWCVSWGLRGRKASVLSQTRAPTAGLERPLAGVTNRGFTLAYRNGISSKAKGWADSLPRALLHNESWTSGRAHPMFAIKANRGGKAEIIFKPINVFLRFPNRNWSSLCSSPRAKLSFICSAFKHRVFSNTVCSRNKGKWTLPRKNYFDVAQINS